jgi:RNA-directed DNA polymerase
MPQSKKLIPLESSKLYRIGTKQDLADLLRISLTDLKALGSDNNYKEWTKKETGKKRLIEEPLPFLSSVLSRLQAILSKIETPDYLLSGKSGIKPQDNAERHRHHDYMVNVDIESFYQSTRRKFVYTTFRDTFGQTNDVASILADLVTYKGHIPTGTATSQLIAFWAYKKSFDRVHEISIKNNVGMTVWVDDITFSANKSFSRNWDRDVDKIMANVELSLKSGKTKFYNRGEYKTATGSAISPSGELLVKNKKRMEILKIVKSKRLETLPLADLRSFVGKISSQRQNEGSFFENMYRRGRARLRELEEKERRKNK